MCVPCALPKTYLDQTRRIGDLSSGVKKTAVSVTEPRVHQSSGLVLWEDVFRFWRKVVIFSFIPTVPS